MERTVTNSIDFKADKNYEIYEHLAQYDALANTGSPFNETTDKGRRMQFMASINDTLVDLESDYKSAVAELKAKIADSDDPVEKQALKGCLDALDGAWRQITHHPPGMHREMGEFSQMWTDRISDMRNSIVDASVASRASDPFVAVDAGHVQVGAPGRVVGESMEGVATARLDRMAQIEKHRGGASGSGSVSNTSTGGGIGAMEFGGKTVDELNAMMQNDPQGLMDHLGTLSPEDKQMAMQMMSQSLQEMNQMFSMMSNIAKSHHDTAKAAINNMRV